MSKNKKYVGVAKAEADTSLPIDTAQRMMEVLKKFPGYKPPGNLPDHLRLPRQLVKKAMLWYQCAKEATENPSVESISQFASMSEKVSFIFRSKKWDKPKNPSPTPEESVADLPDSPDSSDSSYDSDDESDDEDFNKLFGKGFEEGLKENSLEGMDGLADGFAQLGKAMVPMTTGLTKMMMPMLNMVMSKEIMYPSYKTGVDAYKEYIEKNKKTLSVAELKTAKSQMAVFEEIVKLYEEEEEEDEDDSAEVKSQRRAKILELTKKSSELGKPPDEVTAASQAATQGKSFNPEFSGLGEEDQECIVM